MTEAPVLLLERGRNQALEPQRRLAGSRFDHIDAVEIIAPDGYCAALLVGYAAPVFPAVIVSGRSWIVRFEAPPSRGDWVGELLTVVERWLEAAPLPCGKLVYAGQSHLVRASRGETAGSHPPVDGDGPSQAA